MANKYTYFKHPDEGTYEVAYQRRSGLAFTRLGHVARDGELWRADLFDGTVGYGRTRETAVDHAVKINARRK